MTAKSLSLLWLLILSAFFSSANAENPTITAKTEKPLVISIGDDSAPFSLLLPSGKPTGYYVEFWRLWSRYAQQPIHFRVSVFNEIEKNLTSGDIDLHSGMFKNSQRAEWAEFSTPFHAVETGIYFLSSSSDPISIKNLNAQINKTAAVQLGSFQENYVRANFPNITLVKYIEVADIFEQFLNGDIDVIIAEVPYMQSQISGKGLQGLFALSNQKVMTNNVHGLIKKGNYKLLKQVNDGIKSIPIEKLIALEKKWLPNLEHFFKLSSKMKELTSDQKSWLSELPPLKLGVDQAWAPYDFVDNQNNHSGIAADYLQYVNNYLTVDIQVLTNQSWNASLEQIERGEIDLLSAVVKTEERTKHFNFSEPYISFPSIIATLRGAAYIRGIESLSGKKVGVERGYIFEEIYRKKHPNIKLVSFDTAYDGYKSLQSGEIDAFIDALSSYNEQVNQYKLTDISIAAFTPYNLELSFGVRKGLEPLVPILNQALSNMTEKQRSTIANNWLTLKRDENKDIYTFLLWALPIASALLFTILYIVRANRSLQFEISERLKFEDSLEKSIQKADAANQAKDDFLANMSHEVRTPMNAVVGMSDLLSDTKLNKTQQNYTQVIQDSAASLLIIINDILDLSKIEAGKLELESHPFNLKQLIDSIKTQVALDIDRKQLNLSIELADLVPEILYGDKIRLGQIILNLLNNAVKFTPKGFIKIRVTALPDKEHKIGLLFCVEDSGIGLTLEEKKRLFATYGQADNSTTRKYGGTGLGLTICKKLCFLMDGDIWAESQQGKGSQFFFSCYFEQRQDMTNIDTVTMKSSQRVQLENADLLKGCKILLVDDNEINLLIASKVLENEGAEVIKAINGKLAIETLQENTFDLVLMDIQMPVMDGYQATQFIREELKLTKLPIIAITANVMSIDKSRSKEAGMNAHLGKPIKKDQMLKVITQFWATD